VNSRRLGGPAHGPLRATLARDVPGLFARAAGYSIPSGGGALRFPPSPRLCRGEIARRSVGRVAPRQSRGLRAGGMRSGMAILSVRDGLALVRLRPRTPLDRQVNLGQKRYETGLVI